MSGDPASVREPAAGSPGSAAGDPEPDAARLQRLLEAVLAPLDADAILLSGGLDTSILAALASEGRRPPRGFLVSVAGTPAPDEAFARRVADRFGVGLTVLRPKLADLLGRMPDAVRILRTFDPMELRNSVVIHLALEAARDAGARAILTGDAADELFAGYHYMFEMPPERLALYIRLLNEVMRFSSIDLGRALGITVRLPYLDPRVRAFALTLRSSALVCERGGSRFGKAILRRAFADRLPEEILWRVKTPIELGSGSTALSALSREIIGEVELARERKRIAREDGVRLRDSEQCLYYRIYRRIFPPPREGPHGAKACPECRGALPRADQRYCPICGAYPV